MTTWRYIPFQIFTGPENMAIDEMLLDAVAEGQIQNTIRFYKWSPSTASIGQHQSLNSEIYLENLEREHVSVVRRISGGGAVFHDTKGEITYAIICHEKDLPKNIKSPREYDSSIPQRYQSILEALAVGLKHIGVTVDVGRIHCPALLTNGKKISGNAQSIRKGVLLQHGTILLSVDPEKMYRILKAPTGVDYTKMVKSVRAKVTGINNDGGDGSKIYNDDEVTEALKKGFEETFAIELKTNPLTQEELQKIKKLVEIKYANPEWTSKFV